MCNFQVWGETNLVVGKQSHLFIVRRAQPSNIRLNSKWTRPTTESFHFQEYCIDSRYICIIGPGILFMETNP